MINMNYFTSKKFLLLLLKIFAGLLVTAVIATALTFYFIDKSESSDINKNAVKLVLKEEHEMKYTLNSPNGEISIGFDLIDNGIPSLTIYFFN